MKKNYNDRNLKSNEKVVVYVADYRRYIACVIEKVNNTTFQAKTQELELLKGLKYFNAYRLEEFKEAKPLEYAELFPESEKSPTKKGGLPDDRWNPKYFTPDYKVEDSGQISIFDSLEEPPDPDDFSSLDEFEKDWESWEKSQEPKEENFKSTTEFTLGKDQWEELCTNNGNGSISARESVQDSHLLELSAGNDRPIFSANGTGTANQYLSLDTQENNLATSKPSISESQNSQELTSSQLHHPVSPSQLTGKDSEPRTLEIASTTYSEQSIPSSLDSQSLKTCQDCSTVQNDPSAIASTSLESLKAFPKAGTMRNGKLSVVGTLERPGIGKDYLLLRSPGALSSNEGHRPPGKNRLENQLEKLGLLQPGEVCSPEFLEAGYHLPEGFSNPAETRTALELAQAQDLKSESHPVTRSTAIVVSPSVTVWTGESQELDFAESSTLQVSFNTPPTISNLGKLSKNELLEQAFEAHQHISRIERKELSLALEKLENAQRAGLLLQEFKRRCGHGEFESSLESFGIKPRTAQDYMAISKHWHLIESKARSVALIEECQVLSINWALGAIRDEKKSLKSAAAPPDPDCWRTPNTTEQPIVNLEIQIDTNELSNNCDRTPEPLPEPDSTPEKNENRSLSDLNDYCTAVSSNIKNFSSEQLEFIVKIAKAELNQRHHPEYFRERPRIVK